MIFERGKLNISLQANENNDKYSNIILTGREYMYGITDKDTSGKYLYQIIDIKRVYSFDEDSSQYKELSNTEAVIQTMDGVISYHDYYEKQAK